MDPRSGPMGPGARPPIGGFDIDHAYIQIRATHSMSTKAAPSFKKAIVESLESIDTFVFDLYQSRDINLSVDPIV